MHAAILGTPCDDGNICTVGDTCASTGCVGAAGVDLRACGMGGVCCGVMCVAPGTC